MVAVNTNLLVKIFVYKYYNKTVSICKLEKQ